MSTLSAEDITRLLSQTRNRGGHERFIRRFVESGEMYAVVTDEPEYQGKPVQSLRTTLTQKVKSLEGFDNVRLVKADDDTLIIVNTTALEANASDES